MNIDFPKMSKKISNSSQNNNLIQQNKHQSLKPSFFGRSKKNEQPFQSINSPPIPLPSSKSSNKKIIKKYSFESRVTVNNQTPNLSSSQKGIFVQRQKTVPKSKSTHIISSKKVKETSIPSINQHRKIMKILQKQKSPQQMKIYQWRATTHYPVIKVQCISKKQINSQKNKNQACNLNQQSFSQLQLQISHSQDIKFLLPQIQQFSLLNSVYIINESLVSFQRLYNKFGYFEPTLRMIFITNSLKCKVWLNQNIWQNYPLPFKFVSKQHQKVQYFYKKIIQLFSKYINDHLKHQSLDNKLVPCQQTKKSMNLIEKLLYELQQRKDFVQGLKFINQFLNAFSLKLNNKFIYPIEGNSTENKRSRIYSKLVTEPSLRGSPKDSVKLQYQTLHEIPLKQTIQHLPPKQSHKINPNIKTLKNSSTNYHNFCQQHNKDHIRQIKQSNCKTIQKTSQLFHDHAHPYSPYEPSHQHDPTCKQSKEIQFKRKSQISICSKQTIVDKKTRFSVMEEMNKNDQQTSQMIINRNQLVNNNQKQIKNNLPKFTVEDFNQIFDDDELVQQVIIGTQTHESKHFLNHTPTFFNLKKIIPDDEEINPNNNFSRNSPNNFSRNFKIDADNQSDIVQDRIRNQIQKNVREKNGWLGNPLLMLEIDDCAKSFQDSQPSVQMRDRGRSLSKLNRIKKSIANSILEGGNM